jgi:hypothetical protein
MVLPTDEIVHRIALLAGYQLRWSPPDHIYLVFLAIWELHAEVHNGGLRQYFLNSTGQSAPFVCKALDAIGAKETKPLLEAAIAAVGPDIPWNDDSERYRVVYELPPSVVDQLDEIDMKLFDQLDGLLVLLFYFLWQHRDEFEVSAEFWEGITKQ